MTTPTNKPVPSQDPRDLLFNAEKFDQVLNTSAPTYRDRFGVDRKSVAGAVAETIASAEATIDGIGYLPPVPYASGITITTAVQTVEYADVVYAPKLSALPFTTSGTFEVAKFRVVQGVTAAVLAQPPAAGGIGWQSDKTSSAAMSVEDKLNSMPWVEDMILPGDADISLAFARVMANGPGHWQMGPGPFGLDAANTVNWAEGVAILFHSTVINHPTSNKITFWCNNIDDASFLGSLWIEGMGGGTAGTAEGIRRSGCSRFYAENVVTSNIRGRGFYEVGGTMSGTRGDKAVWNNCRSYGCYLGRDDVAEETTQYALWLNYVATGNQYGAFTQAGNVRFVGGNIVDNVLGGMKFSGGPNHAHGGCVGMNINHNGPGSGGYNVRFEDVANGETMVGCHVYADSPEVGQIEIIRSKGILFTGGTLDASVYTEDCTGYSMVEGNFSPDSANTIGLRGNTTEKVICRNNFTREGMWKRNDPGACDVLASRSGVAPQGLTSGIAQKLIFDTESLDTRKAHNTTTGVFTLPWLGKFRVFGSATFSAAGGIPAGGGYLALVVGGFTVATAPIVARSATDACASFCWTAYAGAGATVEVRAVMTLTSGSTYNFAEPSMLNIEAAT